MKIDSTMASQFRMEWLVALDATTQDDYTRAIAEKSDTLLRAARFMSEQHLADPSGVDLEVRVWVEAAIANACVSVTWEPGLEKFGFHLLDESLHERLACIVFDALPCVDASGSLALGDAVLDAALRAIAEADAGARLEEIAARVREAQRSVRVPVQEAHDPDRLS